MLFMGERKLVYLIEEKGYSLLFNNLVFIRYFYYNIIIIINKDDW